LAESVKKLLLVVVALVAATAAAAVVARGEESGLPLAPLSSLGKITPAPNPGKQGPEGVPVPKTTTLLGNGEVREVKLNQTVDGITCQRVEKLAYHIHVHLTIFVDGKAVAVPYGIGIGPPLEGIPASEGGPFITLGSCFMWLHTHALDGIIHIESPTKKIYQLSQFFEVWGQPLSTTQVGPDKGKVTTFYDGKVWTGNPGAIPLTSETQIQLDVGTPIIAPEHIKFPSGLAPSGPLASKSK
jgi:hypothetical protein